MKDMLLEEIDRFVQGVYDKILDAIRMSVENHTNLPSFRLSRRLQRLK